MTQNLNSQCQSSRQQHDERQRYLCVYEGIIKTVKKKENDIIFHWVVCFCFYLILFVFFFGFYHFFFTPNAARRYGIATKWMDFFLFVKWPWLPNSGHFTFSTSNAVAAPGLATAAVLVGGDGGDFAGDDKIHSNTYSFT